MKNSGYRRTNKASTVLTVATKKFVLLDIIPSLKDYLLQFSIVNYRLLKVLQRLSWVILIYRIKDSIVQIHPQINNNVTFSDVKLSLPVCSNLT